jgi:hypothetical protein
VEQLCLQVSGIAQAGERLDACLVTGTRLMLAEVRESRVDTGALGRLCGLRRRLESRLVEHDLRVIRRVVADRNGSTLGDVTDIAHVQNPLLDVSGRAVGEPDPEHDAVMLDRVGVPPNLDNDSFCLRTLAVQLALFLLSNTRSLSLPLWPIHPAHRFFVPMLFGRRIAAIIVRPS